MVQRASALSQASSAPRAALCGQPDESDKLLTRPRNDPTIQMQPLHPPPWQHLVIRARGSGWRPGPTL